MLDSNGKPFEVIRKATPHDRMALFRNRSREEDARRICLGRIEARKLDMKLVDVEMQFDGNKITFFFTAEKRIDFRELVKDLASTFKTRIELRQIGVRDEAKRMDGVGPCGKRLCCSEYLREFQPITLKMAREQHLALSPNKISGVCGRLMCCLAYERGIYVETLKSFPRIGGRVRTAAIEGKTVKADIFTRTLLVRTGEDEDVRIGVDELTEVMRDGKWVPGPGRKKKSS
jgi:cell fate regulator YaaT (PSP1 superfamily)